LAIEIERHEQHGWRQGCPHGARRLAAQQRDDGTQHRCGNGVFTGEQPADLQRRAHRDTRSAAQDQPAPEHQQHPDGCSAHGEGGNPIRVHRLTGRQQVEQAGGETGECRAGQATDDVASQHDVERNDQKLESVLTAGVEAEQRLEQVGIGRRRQWAIEPEPQVGEPEELLKVPDRMQLHPAGIVHHPEIIEQVEGEHRFAEAVDGVRRQREEASIVRPLRSTS
jgi:hypothetical protein